MSSVLTTNFAKKAAALSNPTSATVFLTSADATKAAIAYPPGSLKLNGRAFRIRAVGTATGGTTTNLTIKIQVGTSITAGSNSDLFSSGAIAINSVSGNFNVVGECVWDSTPQKIQGFVEGHLNGTIITQAINSAVTGSDLSVDSATGVGFVCNALFSASNAGNTVSLTNFGVEVL